MSKKRNRQNNVNEEVLEDEVFLEDEENFKLSEEEVKALKIGKVVRKGLKGLGIAAGLFMAYSIGKSKGERDDEDDDSDEDEG